MGAKDGCGALPAPLRLSPAHNYLGTMEVRKRIGKHLSVRVVRHRALTSRTGSFVLLEELGPRTSIDVLFDPDDAGLEPRARRRTFSKGDGVQKIPVQLVTPENNGVNLGPIQGFLSHYPEEGDEAPTKRVHAVSVESVGELDAVAELTQGLWVDLCIRRGGQECHAIKVGNEGLGGGIFQFVKLEKVCNADDLDAKSGDVALLQDCLGGV